MVPLHYPVVCLSPGETSMQSFLLLLLLSCPWPVDCSSRPPSNSKERDLPYSSLERDQSFHSVKEPDTQDQGQFKDMRTPKSLEDIGCIPIDGTAYSGNATTTKSGVPCQKWSVDTPHRSKYHHFGDHNYCRDPFKEKKAWCLTSDPGKRWEYCDIPYCPKLIKGKNKTCHYNFKVLVSI